MTHTPQRTLHHRLRRIEGQIRALSRMIEDDVYCIDIITQISAAKQALAQVENILLEQHMNTCIVRQFATGKTAKAVQEIMHVYKLKRS
jgi:CsoR family transcriptional regulator, copper-sensing transcriptional repressor